MSNDRLLLQSRVHSLEDELEVIRAEVRKRDERRGSTEKEVRALLPGYFEFVVLVRYVNRYFII